MRFIATIATALAISIQAAEKNTDQFYFYPYHFKVKQQKLQE